MKEIYQLDDNSRIWIFQSDIEFTPEMNQLMNDIFKSFVDNWFSHGVKLHAAVETYHDRFVVVVVNQNIQNASGCAIDTLHNFVKSIGVRYNINWFDRMNIAYQIAGIVTTAHLNTFDDLYTKEQINFDTLIFDNTIETLEDLKSRWKVRLEESWIMPHLKVKKFKKL